MLTRKCDICGAEMRMTTPRYKVTFDGWLYTEEIDICVDCFNRIAGEIKQADTPQTDCGKDINVLNKDEPQTETEIAKAIVHKMIDDAVIAEDAYPDLRQKMHDAVDEYEPQTDEPPMDEYYKDHDEFYDCDRYVITNDEGERAYNCIGCQTDCAWK